MNDNWAGHRVVMAGFAAVLALVSRVFFDAPDPDEQAVVTPVRVQSPVEASTLPSQAPDQLTAPSVAPARVQLSQADCKQIDNCA